jgi:hypothetical protein
MKVGDLVRFRRNLTVMGVVISTLNNNGYLDFLRTDGVTIFSHEDSLEVISAAR